MTDKERITSPEAFENPHSIGNRIYRAVWNSIAILLRLTPPRMGWPLRKFILRMFGAKIGQSWLHSSVRIWAPSRLTIGDYVYVDRNVYLYNPWPIHIGDRVVISFDSILCTPSHDFRVVSFPLIGNPINVGNDVWIAARCVIAPGTEIATGSIIGVGAIVVKDTDEWSIYGGNPAKKIGIREVVEK